MSSKRLNVLKKVTVVLLIVMMFTTSAASAYSFGGGNTDRTSMIKSLMDKFSKVDVNTGEYNLKDLNIDLEKMKESGNIDINKITELINKLPNGEDKSILEAIKGMFEKFPGNGGEIDVKALLNKLIETVKSLLGGIGNIGGGSNSNSTLPTPTTVNMDAKTAVEFAGDDYKAKLNANIYMHVDENGNEDSDKWALLIHPFMLKGQTIAKKVGIFYYEKGYNIIAPDLRGFGDSEGKVALGCLESLDIYDWLCAINNNYDVKQVIIHGVSLGGATTNFVSGVDKFMEEGPTKINDLKSLRELNVIGLIEDCGYTDMTEFENKNGLLKRGIGLTEENFDYYSKATNSLKHCDLPMLIIHGTKDTTVKPENADIVERTVKGETEKWLVDGASHAFILMGTKSAEYKEHVQNFIDKYEDETNRQPVVPEKPEQPEEVEKEEPQEKPNYLDKLINAFKSFRR